MILRVPMTMLFEWYFGKQADAEGSALAMEYHI